MLKLKDVSEFLSPDLVVTTITPLPPLTPYIDAKAASFKTFTDFISLGFNEFKSSIDCDTPSITTSGEFPAYEVIPLINTVGFDPGDPLEMILIPDACPCNASSILTGFIASIALELTVDTAPEISLNF